MPIRITPDPAVAGDTVRIIDGPDANAVFVVEVAFSSGTVGVRTCNGELVWFAAPTVCKIPLT